MRHLSLGAVIFSVCVGAGAAGGEPLLYERFENTTVGQLRGGVTFTAEVVASGGLPVPNMAAALFDGQPASGVTHGPATRITTSAFTVEAFIKPVRLPAFAAVVGAWNEEDDQRSWALVLLNTGALRFDVSPDGRFDAQNKLETAPRLIRPGTWYHVAAVSDGAVSRLYVNGREMAATTRAQPGIFVTDRAALTIGNVDRYATDGPRPFHGAIDEVRITAQALSPVQFLQTRAPLPAVRGPVPERYELPFTATRLEDAVRWQQQARTRLQELVAQQLPRYGTDQVPLDFQSGPAEDRGVYTLAPASFQANALDGTRRSCLLAVPQGKGPFPAMLCLHGHGGSAAAVFDPQNLYHGLADRFARGGYVVLAPSLPHREYAAMTLWDLFRCVDVLRARPEVDPDRLGVGGLSMGGEWTMWIAACDPRLKVAVVSGWMCTTEGVFAVPNCACWELPGFVELMDVCEVHLLIAPRPLLLESAEHDTCFPIRYTRAGFARIRAGYGVFGAADAVQQDVWPAGHEWHGTRAYPLVDEVLGGHAAAAPPDDRR